jgi:hypothetical protein
MIGTRMETFLDREYFEGSQNNDEVRGNYKLNLFRSEQTAVSVWRMGGAHRAQRGAPQLDRQIRGCHAARRLFLAACSAHIGVIAAAADQLRWGAFSPFVVSCEE